MSEENFEFEYNALQEMLIVNYQENFSYNMCNEDDVYSVAMKLNEQQDTIDKLKEDVQVYGNTFHFLCFCDNKQMEKKILEQQSTISRLEEENDQLKKRNKFLQEFDGRACREENEKLEQKIKDKNKYQRVLEAKIRRLKDRIKVLEK